jgi:hypothetical protein
LDGRFIRDHSEAVRLAQQPFFRPLREFYLGDQAPVFSPVTERTMRCFGSAGDEDHVEAAEKQE